MKENEKKEKSSKRVHRESKSRKLIPSPML